MNIWRQLGALHSLGTVESNHLLLWTKLLVAQMVKNLPSMQETRVQSLGWEDPLEEEVATHSSILAWRSPWKRSLVGYSPCDHKESDTTE